MDFPGDSDSKVSAYNVGSIPGSGRYPGEGNGNPLQYSCLENPMDGGAWWAAVKNVSIIQCVNYTTKLYRLPISVFFFFNCYNYLFFNLFIWLWVVLVVACGMFSCNMQGLVPWLGIEPRPPAPRSQCLSHWLLEKSQNYPSIFQDLVIFPYETILVLYIAIPSFSMPK